MTGPYGRHFKLGDHVGIVGVPGSGKTWLAKRLVAPAPRVVFFDPKGEYEENGEPIFPQDFHAGMLEGEYVRIAIQAERFDDGDVVEEFRHVTRQVREGSLTFGGVVYVCDELGDYSAGSVKALKRIHANGHKDGVVSLLVSQRAVDLPLGCRATLTRCYSLLQTHPDDLDRLEREFGSSFRQACQEWKPHMPPVAWERIRLYR
jgi:hypothetical protein